MGHPTDTAVGGGPSSPEGVITRFDLDGDSLPVLSFNLFASQTVTTRQA